MTPVRVREGEVRDVGMKKRLFLMINDDKEEEILLGISCSSKTPENNWGKNRYRNKIIWRLCFLAICLWTLGLGFTALIYKRTHRRSARYPATEGVQYRRGAGIPKSLRSTRDYCPTELPL